MHLSLDYPLVAVQQYHPPPHTHTHNSQTVKAYLKTTTP